MKKIMFNDKYGLTKAVLEGRKTMTRRIVPEKLVKAIVGGAPGFAVMESRYKVGEVVAVAQCYNTILNEHKGYDDIPIWANVVANRDNGCPGDDNKMFVRADLMPHQIRITNVRVERLQDISEEDCLREGIREKSSFPHRKSCPFFFDGGKHSWDNSFPTPRAAFAALIDRLSGKGTWKSNPWVFVYEFELVK